MASTPIGHAPPAAARLIQGRIAVQVAAHAGQPERSSSGQFEWRGNADAGSLDLSTPLGTIVAQAEWAPGEALLREQGASGALPLRRFDGLQALLAEVLGEVPPVAALHAWLQGVAWPGGGVEVVQNAQGHYTGFRQLGWTIDLSGRGRGLVVVQRQSPAPAVTLRAVIETPDLRRAP